MAIWNDAKRLRNLHVHGLDFLDAEEIWEGFTVTREDIRAGYGEQRWVTFGLMGGEVVVLVHTERGEYDRYISLRRADRYETIAFFEAARGLQAH
jgi:uncharacterized DUF497 family protein